MGALDGVRVAVTRPFAQTEELAQPLRERGARVLVAPLIRIVPEPLSDEMTAALRALPAFQWLVFTSANGVQQFQAACGSAGVAAALPAGTRVACVGPATAAAARRAGFTPAVIPTTFIGDAVPDAIRQSGPIAGQKVLLARAGGAREVLPARLRELGADVTDMELYRSAADLQGAALLRQEIADRNVDVITFTSSSAVRYFCEHVRAPGKALLAVIGPATAASARRANMEVAIEARPHTIEALVSAISDHWIGGKRQKGS